jgi:hypothetical protein
MKKPGHTGLIDLGAQKSNEDVEIVLADVTIAPNNVNNALPGHDASG